MFFVVITNDPLRFVPVGELMCMQIRPCFSPGVAKPWEPPPPCPCMHMQRYLVTSKGADVWAAVLKGAGISPEEAAFVSSKAYDDALLYRCV